MTAGKTGYQALQDLWLDVRLSADLSHAEAYSTAEQLSATGALATAASPQLFERVARRAQGRQAEKIVAVDAFRDAWKRATGPSRASIAVDIGLPAIDIPAYLDALRTDFDYSATDEHLAAGFIAVASQLVAPAERAQLWSEAESALLQAPVPRRPEPWPASNRTAWVLLCFVFLLFWGWKDRDPGAPDGSPGRTSGMT